MNFKLGPEHGLDFMAQSWLCCNAHHVQLLHNSVKFLSGLSDLICTLVVLSLVEQCLSFQERRLVLVMQCWLTAGRVSKCSNLQCGLYMDKLLPVNVYKLRHCTVSQSLVVEKRNLTSALSLKFGSNFVKYLSLKKKEENKKS